MCIKVLVSPLATLIISDIMACSKPVPGQRLPYFAEKWKQAGADPPLVHLVQHGLKIKFE